MGDLERRRSTTPEVVGEAADEATLNDAIWKDAARAGANVALGMVPVVGPALQGAADAVEGRKQERRVRMLEATAKHLRIEVDELAARFRDHEALAELFLAAWNAAGEARSEAKVRLLSSVLAAAVAGERLRTPVAHVLVEVVEQLEPVHLQLLADVDELAQQEPPTQDDGSPGFAGATPDDVKERSELPHDVVLLLVSDLRSKNLIRNAYERTWSGVEGLEAYVLTELGTAVRDALLGYADS